MSTRCHTIVTKGKNEKAYVYRHFDGYPSCTGIVLKEFVKKNKDEFKNWTVGDFGKNLHEYDEEFEFENLGVHGDEDYIYFVDMNNGNVDCYTSKSFVATEDKNELELVIHW